MVSISALLGVSQCHDCMLPQSRDSQAVNAFCEKAKNLLDDMDKFTKAPSTLKEYSSWLSSFQASHYDEQLEIPGSC